jgi:Pyruvate/2-oxoacid:ferredoxin oxidoreductase delta subunit
MAKRELIRIDEALCDGCGQCVPACNDGAIALVDGKARLVSEVYCDGMGACLGHCPRGAISLELVEAPPFAGVAVAPRRQAPGDGRAAAPAPGAGAPQPSELSHWPVQLHLVSPAAPHFRGADLLLAADCVAFAVGDFHRIHLSGRSLAIACPKLDGHQEAYLDKLVAFIDHAEVASLTVMIMQVPCCGGLVQLALQAAQRASRAVPLRYLVVGVHGDVLDAGPLALPPPQPNRVSLPVR